MRSESGGMFPWVDYLDTAALKVAGVAGGHGSALCTGDGSDLAIELADRSSRSPTLSSDAGVFLRGGTVEGKDAVAQILPQHSCNGLGQRLPSTAASQERHALAQFGLADGCQKNRCPVLTGEPRLDRRLGCCPQ